MSVNTIELIDKRAMLKEMVARRDPAVFELAESFMAEAAYDNDIKLYTQLKLDLAGFYYTIRSDHKMATRLCEEALLELEKWQDPYLLASVNKRIGSYAYFLSD